MSEYIEKKAVTDWLAAKSREASKHAEAQTRCGDVNGGHCFSAESIAYLETETFINSLPTQEDKSDTRLLDMLLEAINYVYKQLDGKYGNLSYVVSDKVKYIERVRAEKIEQKKREEFEARERGETKPEADFDELIKQEMVKVYETYTRPDYIEENTTEAAYDFDMHVARHFAKWGAEHADKPIYEVSSNGKSAMGDKFFDWLQFGTHALWDWMVKTDWYKKLNDMSDELIVKVYLGKKRKEKHIKR